MENVTTTTTVKTRVAKDGDAHETALSINWDCSDEQLRELAQSSVVIKWQAIQRAAGKIPTTDTLNVASLFVKSPRTNAPLTPEKVLAKAKADPAFLEQLKQLLDAQHHNAPISPDDTDETK